MAKTTTLPFTQTITQIQQSLVNADSFVAANGGTAPTNTKLVTTAGTDGSVIKALTVASDDSGARVLSFYLSTDAGTTKYLIGSISVAAGAGVTSGTTLNSDVLANAYIVGLAQDQTGRPVISLQANARLYVAVQTAAVTAGRTVHITGFQEDY